MINKKKIELYADGLTIEEFDFVNEIEIDGYTFNPSIFKKNGAKDYLDYSKKIISKCNTKPLSLEVIADTESEMVNQAITLSKLSKNIYVKIPITYTNEESTSSVISSLVKKNVKLNITAIFTLKQIEQILPIVKETETILSVFAGRIFDCGQDANAMMKEICNFVKKHSNCKVLWASPRMSYDYINAINSGCDIITMQLSQIKKLKMFGKSLSDYSLETVKQFHQDAISSGYKF
ncbi:transaldolase family protein [Candidatus Pelagibacter sp. HIMB123]|uniref:transaldolase family protein n=1 Tax=Candidatus Pelagibacter sp. HIMB123 TaxID=3415413 RepID=UPI003F8324D4